MPESDARSEAGVVKPALHKTGTALWKRVPESEARSVAGVVKPAKLLWRRVPESDAGSVAVVVVKPTRHKAGSGNSASHGAAPIDEAR